MTFGDSASTAPFAAATKLPEAIPPAVLAAPLRSCAPLAAFCALLLPLSFANAFTSILYAVSLKLLIPVISMSALRRSRIAGLLVVCMALLSVHRRRIKFPSAVFVADPPLLRRFGSPGSLDKPPLAFQAELPGFTRVLLQTGLGGMKLRSGIGLGSIDIDAALFTYANIVCASGIANAVHIPYAFAALRHAALYITMTLNAALYIGTAPSLAGDRNCLTAVLTAAPGNALLMSLKLRRRHRNGASRLGCSTRLCSRSRLTTEIDLILPNRPRSHSPCGVSGKSRPQFRCGFPLLYGSFPTLGLITCPILGLIALPVRTRFSCAVYPTRNTRTAGYS